MGKHSSKWYLLQVLTSMLLLDKFLPCVKKDSKTPFDKVINRESYYLTLSFPVNKNLQFVVQILLSVRHWLRLYHKFRDCTRCQLTSGMTPTTHALCGWVSLHGKPVIVIYGHQHQPACLGKARDQQQTHKYTHKEREATNPADQELWEKHSPRQSSLGSLLLWFILEDQTFPCGGHGLTSHQGILADSGYR